MPPPAGPSNLTRAQQDELGLHLGRDWPRPLVDLDASVAANRERWEVSV